MYNNTPCATCKHARTDHPFGAPRHRCRHAAKLGFDTDSNLKYMRLKMTDCTLWAAGPNWWERLK